MESTIYQKQYTVQIRITKVERLLKVFAQAYYRRHYAPRTSAAYCLKVLSQLAALGLSCVIAYNTGGFWSKTRVVQEQPDVSFTYDALLLLEGKEPGEQGIWTSFSHLNPLFESSAASVHIQVAQSDINFDGLYDTITIEAKCFGVRDVSNVKLLMQFHYKLKKSVQLQMYTLGYAHYSSGSPGTSLHLDGELFLKQRTPLWEGTLFQQNNAPILKGTGFNGSVIEAASQLQLENIISNYLDRNETTMYKFYPVWKVGTSQDFFLKVVVRVPPEENIIIRLRPLDMLKLAWIQILSIYVILLFLLSKWEDMLFSNRVLTTRVVSDLDKPVRSF